jgi:S1-C subfamily serine protease
VQPQPGFVGVHVLPPQGSDRYWKIGSVAVDSPAAKAGLKAGDAIIKADDQQIVDGRLLAESLRGRNAGDVITFQIERDGKQQDIKVTAAATSRPLGLTNNNITLGVRLSESVDGLKIDGFQTGSSAELAGVKAGDVIVKLDDTPITGTDVFSSTLALRKAGDAVTLVVKRANEELKLNVKATTSEAGGGGRRQSTRWDERTATTFKKPVYRLALVPIEYSDVKHNPRFGLADWENMLFSTGSYVGKSPSGQPSLWFDE